MDPLLCRADDGALYVLKPFSTNADWPLVLEWTCARLGRAVGLPIPNYRQVVVGEEIAEAWNAMNARKVEAGIGFGSQFVESATECNESDLGRLREEDTAFARRLLAFDWWVRNKDRTGKNTNLLWCPSGRCFHVIDHAQAGQSEGGDLFWSLHVFSQLAKEAESWPPPEIVTDFRAALAHCPVIEGELPSTWTSRSSGVPWLFTQLARSLEDGTHREWRHYE
jgi:hypothetical protein